MATQHPKRPLEHKERNVKKRGRRAMGFVIVATDAKTYLECARQPGTMTKLNVVHIRSFATAKMTHAFLKQMPLKEGQETRMGRYASTYKRKLTSDIFILESPHVIFLCLAGGSICDSIWGRVLMFR